VRYLVIDSKEQQLIELLKSQLGKSRADAFREGRKTLKNLFWAEAEEVYFRKLEQEGKLSGKVVFVVDDQDIIQGEQLEYELRQRRAAGACTWGYLLAKKQDETVLHHVRLFVGRPYTQLREHGQERFGCIPWRLLREALVTEELLREPEHVVFVVKEDGIVTELQTPA